MEIGARAETIQTTALLNTEKSSGDPRRLAVTQSLMKNHQITLCEKLANNNNNNAVEYDRDTIHSWNPGNSLQEVEIRERIQTTQPTELVILVTIIRGLSEIGRRLMSLQPQGKLSV